MRDPLTVLLAIGIFVVGGYAGFVWLANPSTTGHDATSRPLHAETTLKANMPSEADRTAQESSSKSQEGSSKKLAVATPAVPREQATRVEHDPQTVGSVRDHETVGSAREHEPKTVAGASVDDQNAVNLPSKGSDVRTGVNPMPRAKVKLATDSSRTIVENGYKRTKVRQFSRTDWRRQKRFSELLNDPLAFNCMNCLLFGY